jgi:HPt (histidine-containing phosphotransfer) domain-containing protein
MAQGFDDFLSKPLQTANLNTILVRYIKAKYPQEVIEQANLKKARDIDNFQQSEGLQQTLRSVFAKKQRNTYEEITAAIRANDIKRAHIMAHSLKGAAGLIHEHALAHIAGKIEARLEADNIPAEDDMLALQSELDTVLCSLAPAGDGENKANSEIIALLDSLTPMLQQRNGACLDYVQQLRNFPQAAILIKNIEDFNFKTALINIETLRDIV